MKYKLFKGNNIMGFIMKIIGLIVVAYGFINGIVMNAEISREFGEVNIIQLHIFFTPMIVGILIVGFGEVIDLLQKIADKDKPMLEEQAIPTSIVPPTPDIPLYAETEINEFYSNKDVEIKTIEPTRKRDIFKVEVNGQTEYIEIGGFSPKVLSEEEAQNRLK